MILIADEIHAAAGPASYDRLQKELGLVSRATVQRRQKKFDFDEGCTEELKQWTKEVIEGAENKAEMLGEYVPTRTGKRYNPPLLFNIAQYPKLPEN